MRNGFAEKTSETRHSRRLDGRLRPWPSAHIVGQPATKGLPQRLSVNGAVCGVWCLQDDGSAAGGFECQCTADLNAAIQPVRSRKGRRSEEHTSELQSLMRISYAVFCLKKKNKYIPTYTVLLVTTHTRNTLYTQL